MVNTTQLKNIIEPWFRQEYLRRKYPNAYITQKQLSLSWGGQFEYDAVVYENGKLAAIYLLSCSEFKTNNGKGGAGKFHKIKSDTLMLLGTESPKKVMAFLGESMYRQFKAQQIEGRLPQDILAELVQPSPEIESLVRSIREQASREVTPSQPSSPKRSE